MSSIYLHSVRSMYALYEVEEIDQSGNSISYLAYPLTDTGYFANWSIDLSFIRKQEVLQPASEAI